MSALTLPETNSAPSVFSHLAGNYGAIYADPPWAYEAWSGSAVPSRVAEAHYQTMPLVDIAALPVSDIAARDCVLFLWVTWPTLLNALKLIEAWGFTYKTCAFNWMKANVSQMDMFRDDATPDMLLGYWTRANTEACLLATRGKPKRLHADVRQARSP